MNRKPALALALLAAVWSAAAVAEAPPAPAFTREEAQAAIWAKEQAIYGGRARGEIDNYVNATADDYAAWPPGMPEPIRVTDLNAARASMASRNQELLAMEYVDMSLSGNTAVIYYRTHRTRLGTGEVVDERFNVTHTWVHNGEDWQVLGGLARKVSE